MDNFTALPVSALLDSFTLHLRARNRSPKTISSYVLAVTQLCAHLDLDPDTDDPSSISKSDVESFLVHFLETRSSATTRQRYASLSQFFKWAYDESELPSNPMDRISPPHVAVNPVPVLTVDDLKALLKACSGKGFESRRDDALIRLFADTGIRLGEMAGLQIDDVDLAFSVAVVKGKGSRIRTVPFSDSTAASLDRYRRVRLRHDNASSQWWWLGSKGALSSSGVNQILKRRAGDAGLDSLHAHMFRHTFAHRWLAAGGNEGDLQRIAGWSSPQMLQRYGASAADERARENYRKNPLWDL